MKKKVRSQIKNLTLHSKELEKEQTKPKVSRRKERQMRVFLEGAAVDGRVQM